MRGKISPGVLSLRPGATLDMRVPPQSSSYHACINRRTRAYGCTTSRAHPHGRSPVELRRQLRMRKRRVEALNAEGRASVFEGLELAAHGSLHNCALRARLLGDSGSVGKFKIARPMVPACAHSSSASLISQ